MNALAAWGIVNDALRRVIGLLLAALGLVSSLRQRWLMDRYRRAQAALRRRFGIQDDTPIRPFGAEQEASIAAVAERLGPGRARYATTSGSTDAPKRILYPAERLRRTRWHFIEAFARDIARAPLKRHVFFAFSSPQRDGSLTALLTEERARVPYLAVLQAPHRVLGDGALRELARAYGETALRLWVLALANPGTLYATNPSTLSTFLDRVTRDWDAAAALARDFSRDPGTFSRAVRRIARRLTATGARTRLARIARAAGPLRLWEIAPGVHTYVCWTGGYVQPFLERLTTHLPPARYRLLPMYSMSTETPQTTPWYRRDRLAFVPLADGVLYEFLPEHAPDAPANLRAPWELVEGGVYTMVVSDSYGLRRYQTDDLFACVGRVGDLPDLRFIRRRSLSYSFTGEKLTGEQMSIALTRLRAERNGLGTGAFLTCVPELGGDDAVPRYRLLQVGDHVQPAADIESVAQQCDLLLAELNHEYAAKRRSGRLGPMRGSVVSLEDFLRGVGGPRAAAWEGQFKFLPLYPRLWQGASAGNGPT